MLVMTLQVCSYVQYILMGLLQAVSIKRTLEYPFKEDYHWWASVELLRQSLSIVFIIIDPGNLVSSYMHYNWPHACMHVYICMYICKYHRLGKILS